MPSREGGLHAVVSNADTGITARDAEAGTSHTARVVPERTRRMRRCTDAVMLPEQPGPAV
jgi:hypothetical protein